MSDLPEPVKVSPLIRCARWTLLLAGIFYGYTRQKFLAGREVHIRAEEERRKAIRDKKLMEQRRIASERDVKDLARIFTEKPSKSDHDGHGTCGPP
ncbi:putative ATP synthesis coupled proton transport [Trypoxylus dichotomus]